MISKQSEEYRSGAPIADIVRFADAARKHHMHRDYPNLSRETAPELIAAWQAVVDAIDVRLDRRLCQAVSAISAAIEAVQEVSASDRSLLARGHVLAGLREALADIHVMLASAIVSQAYPSERVSESEVLT